MKKARLEGEFSVPQWKIMEEDHPQVVNKRKYWGDEEITPRKRAKSEEAPIISQRPQQEKPLSPLKSGTMTQAGQSKKAGTMAARAGTFGTGFAAFASAATGFGSPARPSDAPLFAPAKPVKADNPPSTMAQVAQLEKPGTMVLTQVSGWKREGKRDPSPPPSPPHAPFFLSHPSLKPEVKVSGASTGPDTLGGLFNKPQNERRKYVWLTSPSKRPKANANPLLGKTLQDLESDEAEVVNKQADLRATLGTAKQADQLRQQHSAEEEKIKEEQTKIDARNPKASIQDGAAAKQRRLDRKLQKFAALEGSKEDHLPENPAAEMSLWDQCRANQLQTRPTFESYNTGLATVRLRHYGDRSDDDDEHDSDYEDVDYDYGAEKDTRDPDDIRNAKMEKEEASFDPDFVEEEIHNGVPQGIKIPSYRAYVEPEEENETTPEAARQEAETMKAWKNFEAARGGLAPAAASDEYKVWFKQVTKFSAQEEGDEVPFPKIVGWECYVSSRECVRGEKLGICQHDVARVLKGSGIQVDGDEWLERLKRERLRWHPDKFSSKMGAKWAAEAQELFQMLQALMEREVK
jgi:hypothetical protein